PLTGLGHDIFNRVCPGSDFVYAARDLINRLIAGQERRVMKYQHIRVSLRRDRQFARFTESARRAARMKSAEARIEFDSFSAGGFHKRCARQAVEAVRVILKSEFVITGENRLPAVV